MEVITRLIVYLMELSVSEGWKVWLSSISFLEDGFIGSIYHVVSEICTLRIFSI